MLSAYAAEEEAGTAREERWYSQEVPSQLTSHKIVL